MRGLIACVLLLLSVACTRTVYQPVESVREVTRLQHDTLQLVQWRIDSVFVRDSTAMVQRGDTVYLTKWRERVQLKLVHDTIKTASADSVAEYMEKPVPYEVEKRVEVERELTWWQRFRLNTWAWVVGVAAFYCLWRNRKRIIELATKILRR